MTLVFFKNRRVADGAWSYSSSNDFIALDPFHGPRRAATKFPPKRINFSRDRPIK
jgi:hypothetical protein